MNYLNEAKEDATCLKYRLQACRNLEAECLARGWVAEAAYFRVRARQVARCLAKFSAAALFLLAALGLTETSGAALPARQQAGGKSFAGVASVAGKASPEVLPVVIHTASTSMRVKAGRAPVPFPTPSQRQTATGLLVKQPDVTSKNADRGVGTISKVSGVKCQVGKVSSIKCQVSGAGQVPSVRGEKCQVSSAKCQGGKVPSIKCQVSGGGSVGCQPVRAIVGEAAGQPYAVKLAVACAIRNRCVPHGPGLRGVYGLNAAHNATEPAKVWQEAARAWAESARRDVTGGADHFGNASDVRKGTFSGMRLVAVVGAGRDATYFFRS